MSVSLLKAPVAASTVTTVRTVNSIYVLVEYPGEVTSTMTCVEGTFRAERFRVHRESTHAPVAGQQWLVMLVTDPWDYRDRILTSDVLEVSTI